MTSLYMKTSQDYTKMSAVGTPETPCDPHSFCVSPAHFLKTKTKSTLWECGVTKGFGGPICKGSESGHDEDINGIFYMY